MDLHNKFKNNLIILNQHRIYASTGREEFEQLFNIQSPSSYKPSPEVITHENLFKSNISQDLIDIVRRYGDNAIGMVGHDNNDELTTIDEDLLHEIQYMLQQKENSQNQNNVEQNIRITKDGYKAQGLPPIPFYMLNLVDRLGNKAMYKKMKNPNGTNNDIVITPKLFSVAQEAIEYLKNMYGDLATAEKAHSNEDESIYDKFFEKNPIKASNKIQKRYSMEDGNILTVSKEEANKERGIQEVDQSIYSNASLFDIFMSDPSKATFTQLLEGVQNTLGEGDTYGKNEITELLELAQQEGLDWITEDNIKFLYELFNV